MTHSKANDDNLTLKHSLREALRSLFLLGAEALFLESGNRRLLLAKEKIISLLERGVGEQSLTDVLDRMGVASTRQLLDEGFSACSRILCVTPSGISVRSAMDLKMSPSADLPAWWDAPLPFLAIRDGALHLNNDAQQLVGEQAPTADLVLDALKGDENLLVVGKGKQKRTFCLSPLRDRVFLIEDVSSDVEMAENMAWWAAVGKVLAERLASSGLRLREHRNAPKPPSGNDVLPCIWEERLVGFLSFDDAKAPELVEEPPKKVPQKKAPSRKSAPKDVTG